MTEPHPSHPAPSRRLQSIRIAALMLIAISAWTLYLIQMDAAIFNDPEGSAMQKWMTWLGIPIVGVVVILLAQSGLTALAEARGASR